MSNQLPHDYERCNCGTCKMIRLELKRDGTTTRAIPTGPVSELHTPPSKRQAKTPGKPKPRK
jgi:hypothetical protein